MIKKTDIPSDVSLFSVAETAELLNIKANTLYHWNIRDYCPQLHRVKVGGRIYFTAASVASLLK